MAGVALSSSQGNALGNKFLPDVNELPTNLCRSLGGVLYSCPDITDLALCGLPAGEVDSPLLVPSEAPGVSGQDAPGVFLLGVSA